MSYCPNCSCPNCRRQSGADPVEELRSWCERQGHWVGPGDVVTELVAAAVLGKSPETLRGWRSTDPRLPFTRSRAGVRYALQDLVRYQQGEIG